MAQREDTRRLAAAREVLINDPDSLHSISETTVQRLLGYEITKRLQAGSHEPTDARKGNRTGYKPRTLKAPVGALELRVQQDPVKQARNPRHADESDTDDVRHELGEVVAEGVETRAQMAWLRDAGCAAAQGFLFCKPQPAERIARLLGRAISQGVPKRVRGDIALEGLLVAG